MYFGVTGVASAGGGLRRVALRRETVARWTVYGFWGDGCGECRGRAAEGCIEEGNGGAMVTLCSWGFEAGLAVWRGVGFAGGITSFC